MGAVFLALGENEQALQSHQLKLACSAADRLEEAQADSSLGSILHCHRDFKQAVSLHRRVLDMALELGDRTLETRAYAGLGHSHRGLQEPLQAKDYHEKQLDHALQTKDKAAEGRACSNLGIVYQQLGEFDAALKLHKVHLQIAKDLGDRPSQGRAYGNIGNAHSSLGQFELAVRFHKQELLISQEVSDRQAEASTHGNLGVAYQALGLHEQALNHYSSHLRLARTLGDTSSEARALSNLGHYHCGRREWSAALPLYTQYLDLSQELQDVSGEGRACHRLGYIHQRLGNHPEAVRYYTQDLALARELQDHASLCRAYCNLGLAHRALGDLPKALESHKYCLAAAIMCKDADAQFLALSNIGDVLSQSEDTDEALKIFHQQLTLARQTNSRKLEAAALANLGSVHKKFGQFDKALGYHNQELTILQEVSDLHGECRAHGNLGNIHVSLGKYTNACRCYEEQLERSQDLQDSTLKAHAHGNLGITKINMGCFSEAIGHFESQLAVLEQMPGAECLRVRGQSYRHLATCHESLGDFSQAVTSYERYLTLSQTTGSVVDQEAAYRGLGTAHRSLGNLQQALVCLEKRLVAAHELDDPEARSSAYGELGCLHSLLGNFEQALSCLGHQLRAARDRGDLAAEAEAACGLGGVYQQMGDYNRALEYHSLDQTIADQLSNDAYKCRACGNLGLCHESLGNFEQALQQQERHLSIATDISDDTEKTLAYSSLGRIHHAEGRYLEAVQCLEAGLQIAQHIGRVEDEARIRHRLGLSLWGLGDLQTSQDQLYSAISLFEGIRQNVQTNNEYKLSLFDLQTASYQALQRVLVGLGRTDDALVVAERGRTRAFVDLLLERQTSGETSSDMDPSPVTLEQITDTVSRQRVAVLYFSMAAGFLYSWLILPDRGIVKFHESPLGESDANSGNDSQSLKSCHSISTATVSLLDSYVGQAREALGVESHLASSRASLNRVGGSLSETESEADDIWQRHLEELGDRINTEGDHTGFLRMERRDHVWNASSYSLGSVLSLPSGLLGPRSGSVHSRSSTLGQSASHNTSAAGRPALASLYELLIAPMDDVLPPPAGHRGCRDLVLVLQGDLYLVPFTVLRPCQTSSALYERYHLLAAPSLRSLMVKRPPTKHTAYSPECTGAAVIGNPKLHQSVVSTWQWSALPATELECRTVAEMMGCRTMTGASATKDNVLKEISCAELVHFATHISWKLTAIVLSASNFSTTSSVHGDLERMDLNDTSSLQSLSVDGPPLCEFLLTAADLLNLRLHARLVVLSSGHSDDRAGRINADGVVGLTRAMLAAGAQCVLFALWPVPEMATRVLMRAFYTALLQGARASQALSSALKSLQSSRQFSHPSNWACWMLVGTDIRLSSQVALMGHALCQLLRSPTQCREAMRVTLHLVEKSLQRMQQGQRKAMYTTQQSIENKVGDVQGWRELLTSVGFRLEPSTNDLPAAVFFPTFDPGERLMQCSASLQALLGLSAQTLSALAAMVNSPETGEIIINLVREASSRLISMSSRVDVPVCVQIWRSPGVHEFLASLGFDLVEVGKDQVTLKVGKNANRKVLQFGLQSLMAVFDTAAAPRDLLLDSSSSMESLCSSGSSSVSKGSPSTSPIARKRSFFNPAEVEKLPSAKPIRSTQTTASPGQAPSRSDITLHLDRQNIIREKYSSPSGSELSDAYDRPRVISVDTGNDSCPESWERPASRRAENWTERSLDSRSTPRRSQRSQSASRTRSRSDRSRGPIYSSSGSDSDDEVNLSRTKSRSSQSLTSLASTLTLRSTTSAPSGFRRNRSRASVASTRSSASDRTLTSDSRHGSQETLVDPQRVDVQRVTNTEHMSDSGIHSKLDTATDNSADTDALEPRLKSRPQNRRRERSLPREEYKLDDRVVPETAHNHLNPTSTDKKATNGVLQPIVRSTRTIKTPAQPGDSSKPPSGRIAEPVKPCARAAKTNLGDPVTVTHKLLPDTGQQMAVLENVHFSSVRDMKYLWEYGNPSDSMCKDKDCSPPVESDPKESKLSQSDKDKDICDLPIPTVKEDHFSDKLSAAERQDLFSKHRLLMDPNPKPKPRPILANSLTDGAISYTCSPGERVSQLSSQSEPESEPDISHSELESEPELSVIEEESEPASDANTSFGPESELSIRLVGLRLDRNTTASPGTVGDQTIPNTPARHPASPGKPEEKTHYESQHHSVQHTQDFIPFFQTSTARRKSVTFQEKVQTEIISETDGECTDAECPSQIAACTSVSPPIDYKPPPPYPGRSNVARRSTDSQPQLPYPGHYSGAIEAERSTDSQPRLPYQGHSSGAMEAERSTDSQPRLPYPGHSSGAMEAERSTDSQPRLPYRGHSIGAMEAERSTDSQPRLPYPGHSSGAMEAERSTDSQPRLPYRGHSSRAMEAERSMDSQTRLPYPGHSSGAMEAERSTDSQTRLPYPGSTSTEARNAMHNQECQPLLGYLGCTRSEAGRSTACQPHPTPAQHQLEPVHTTNHTAARVHSHQSTVEGDLNTPLNLQRMARHFYQGTAAESMSRATENGRKPTVIPFIGRQFVEPNQQIPTQYCQYSQHPCTAVGSQQNKPHKGNQSSQNQLFPHNHPSQNYQSQHNHPSQNYQSQHNHPSQNYQSQHNHPSQNYQSQHNHPSQNYQSQHNHPSQNYQSQHNHPSPNYQSQHNHPSQKKQSQHLPSQNYQSQHNHPSPNYQSQHNPAQNYQSQHNHPSHNYQSQHNHPSPNYQSQHNHPAQNYQSQHNHPSQNYQSQHNHPSQKQQSHPQNQTQS